MRAVGLKVLKYKLSESLAYAEVAKLDPSDPRWRRCWRALQLAAFRLAEAL